jgi:four helix bundle protein
MKFEDLKVWQKAQQVFLAMNDALKESKMLFFKDQILRASLSISNNIAEGFERKSNKEYQYFLYVAKGSCGEVRSMIHLGKHMKLFSEEFAESIQSECLEISYMLNGLIKSISKERNQES